MLSKRSLIISAVSVLLLLVAAAAGLYLLYSRLFSRPQLTETVQVPALLLQVRQLSELVSVKYSVQKVVGLREDKVPVGSESILLVVQGTVLGGVDLKELNERDIHIEADRVLLRLPEPKILHVYLDDKHTQVWDRKVTWWTPWVPYNPDLERQARLRATESIRAQAEEMGILRDARKNAESTVRTFIEKVTPLKVVIPPT